MGTGKLFLDALTFRRNILQLKKTDVCLRVPIVEHSPLNINDAQLQKLDLLKLVMSTSC